MKTRVLALGALAIVAVAADLTLGGTAPLNASGAKRRVTATVDTTTAIVAAPVVETKIETTGAWVVDQNESIETEAAKLFEEPIRPIIPVFTAFTIFDCNMNGTDDAAEIEAGADDADGDGVLDSCEYALGDLNLNGVVDSQDVSILLGWWGIENPLYGDLNGDNIVDAVDLGILLGRFGVVVY